MDIRSPRLILKSRSANCLTGSEHSGKVLSREHPQSRRPAQTSRDPKDARTDVWAPGSPSAAAVMQVRAAAVPFVPRVGAPEFLEEQPERPWGDQGRMGLQEECSSGESLTGCGRGPPAGVARPPGKAGSQQRALQAARGRRGPDHGPRPPPRGPYLARRPRAVAEREAGGRGATGPWPTTHSVAAALCLRAAGRAAAGRRLRDASRRGGGTVRDPCARPFNPPRPARAGPAPAVSHPPIGRLRLGTPPVRQPRNHS
ncbi:collagen alpha-1(I) chain-like [Cavia porcellus]|uniref:collagen alpha-1(I) chain-like n=1 Tax=Cavia porcellus TaxID=10141 RepID=UPI002FE40349